MTMRGTALVALAFGLFAFMRLDVAVSEAQPPDPRVADLVHAGKIRVALFLPQYTKHPVTGELQGAASGGVHIEIARAFAAHLGAQVVLAGYPAPPRVVECLKADTCDIAFMGINPARAKEVGFAPSHMEVDFTYLVPAGASIRSVTDADRPGVRIAVVRNHESTLVLSRMLKQAELVYGETPDSTFELLHTERADAWASSRSALLDYDGKLPGSRVLDDRYGSNLTAMTVSKSNAGRLAYVSEFIEEAKASALVQRAIERVGLRGVQVPRTSFPN